MKLERDLANAAAADLQRQLDAERKAHTAAKCRLEDAEAYARQLESARVYT
jgi:hypothetical protein